LQPGGQHLPVGCEPTLSGTKYRETFVQVLKGRYDIIPILIFREKMTKLWMNLMEILKVSTESQLTLPPEFAGRLVSVKKFA